MKTNAILLAGGANDCPDIEYASGFRAVDPVVFVRQGKNDFLVVPVLERAHAAGKSRARVFTPESLEIPAGERGRLSAWALAIVKKLGIRTVTAASTLYHGIAAVLAKNNVRIIVVKKPLFPERAVKSAAEIRKIADAQQAAVIAMRKAVELIAGTDIDSSGALRARGKVLTCEHVKTVIQEVLVAHNCICRDLIVSCGPRTAVPHERGTGPMRAGEPIIMDIFPQHLETGYWGDLTRTLVRGKASPVLERMYQAVKAAQTAALGILKAGINGSTVHREAVKEFEKRGFRNQVLKGMQAGFIHGTGHGVGLTIHESPALGFAPVRLRSGNVVTVEPGLYYPDIGGIRIEDTVVVTAGGWRYLVPCEKRFEV